ncbi:MAG: DUF1648 domain-containing protein [bacterium]
MRTRLMRLQRTIPATAVSLLLICLLYMAMTHPHLPDRMAVHFNVHGEPDGWSNKSSFFVWYSLVVVGINVLFLVLLPFLLGVIPDSLINLPWKEYWFSSPERKKQALDRIRVFFYLICAHINAVFLTAYHIVVQENTPDPLFRIPVKIFIAVCIISASIITFVGLILCTKPPKTASETG